MKAPDHLWPVDGKRRKELKDLFAGCKAGLVFVTAFESRRAMQTYLANSPFNDSGWFRKDDDVRWQFGVPPKGNANFAWVQHFIHHLAPHKSANPQAT